MSRIGKQPVEVPKNVKIALDGNLLKAEGPKGKLEFRIPDRITAKAEAGRIILTRATDQKKDKSLHGTSRTCVQNMIRGVTEGYSKELEIQGVGYRAQIQGKTLIIQLGFSHPINYAIPEGITVETPKPTSLLVRGCDKARVGQVAAELRDFFPPEPYKGKGIRYVGEHVRRKAGKAVA